MTKFSDIPICEKFYVDGLPYLKLPVYRSELSGEEYNAVALSELVLEDAITRFDRDRLVSTTNEVDQYVSLTHS